MARMIPLSLGRFDDLMRRASDVARARPLGVVATKELGSVGAVPTGSCFQNHERYYLRDRKLDSDLPAVQPALPPSAVIVYQAREPMTFAEMAAEVAGVSSDTPIEALSELLKERGYTMTLPAIESVIELQEHGEAVGLQTDDCGDIFFVENKQGGISVIYASRRAELWDVDDNGFASSYRWQAGHRLIVRKPGILSS